MNYSYYPHYYCYHYKTGAENRLRKKEKWQFDMSLYVALSSPQIQRQVYSVSSRVIPNKGLICRTRPVSITFLTQEHKVTNPERVKLFSPLLLPTSQQSSLTLLILHSISLYSISVYFLTNNVSSPSLKFFLESYLLLISGEKNVISFESSTFPIDATKTWCLWSIKSWYFL